METQLLRAGAVNVLLTENRDLRYLSVGGQEIIRRIYAAVRAADWSTVPATITVKEKTVAADSFRLLCDAQYTDAERGVDFRATLTMTGDADGRITFDFDGESLTAFERARIGICVLHPADAKGAPVTITHTDGTTQTGNLPGTISPHQPFLDIAAIRHTAAPGLDTEVTFTGDVFEMEDQRNWLDASFKTYSTPLSRPFPVRVEVGERVQQSVSVVTTQTGAVAEKTGLPESLPELLAVHLELPTAQKDALASHQNALTAYRAIIKAERERHYNEYIAHIMDPSNIAPPNPEVFPAPDAAASMSVGVMWHDDMLKPKFALGLPVGGHLWMTVEQLRAKGRRQVNKAQKFARRHHLKLFVVVTNTPTTVWGWIEATSVGVLTPVRFFMTDAAWYTKELPLTGVEFSPYVGVVSNFTELNRARPDAEAMTNGVFFAGNPQVHADDDLSIAETPAIIAEQIRTARTFAGNKPVHVGPLTFRGVGSPPDTRETGDLGKAWYTCVLAHALAAGAGSITFGFDALPVLREIYREATLE